MKFPWLKSLMGVGFPGSGSSGALQTVLGLGAGKWQGDELGAGAAGIGALICSASVSLILQQYRNYL